MLLPLRVISSIRNEDRDIFQIFFTWLAGYSAEVIKYPFQEDPEGCVPDVPVIFQAGSDSFERLSGGIVKFAVQFHGQTVQPHAGGNQFRPHMVIQHDIGDVIRTRFFRP